MYIIMNVKSRRLLVIASRGATIAGLVEPPPHHNLLLLSRAKSLFSATGAASHARRGEMVLTPREPCKDRVWTANSAVVRMLQQPLLRFPAAGASLPCGRPGRLRR